MEELQPLESLYDATSGEELPLPAGLARFYGAFRLFSNPARPNVFANFVETLDGVVALGPGDRAGGGIISGFSPQDRAIMGLLRAVADVVVVGAGTLRPGHEALWTAESIYPALSSDYQRLRQTLGLHEPPLTVTVTARGDLDPGLRVLRTCETPALIVTTADGAARLRRHKFPGCVTITEAGQTGRLNAAEVLAATHAVRPSKRILVEGGPHLMSDFIEEGVLDELFLTLAPQLAGRAPGAGRLGLVEGRRFLPESPRWSSLSSVKKADSFLFLRYTFAGAG